MSLFLSLPINPVVIIISGDSFSYISLYLILIKLYDSGNKRACPKFESVINPNSHENFLMIFLFLLYLFKYSYNLFTDIISPNDKISSFNFILSIDYLYI